MSRVPLTLQKTSKLAGSFLGSDVVSSSNAGFAGASVSVKATTFEKKQRKAVVKAVVAEPIPTQAPVSQLSPEYLRIELEFSSLQVLANFRTLQVPHLTLYVCAIRSSPSVLIPSPLLPSFSVEVLELVSIL